MQQSVRGVRRGAAATVTAAMALGLCSCARLDPSGLGPAGSEGPVTIAVNPEDTAQMVLGEIYKQTLDARGRETTVVEAPDLAFGEYDANVYLGCTGELLEAFDSGAAEKLSQSYVKSKKTERKPGKDWLEATHRELMGALPPELAVVAPAEASGCPDADLRLPENYVAVYQKGLFDRDEIGALSSLTVYITDAHLSGLVGEAERKSVPVAVSEWMQGGRADPDEGGKDKATAGDADSGEEE